MGNQLVAGSRESPLKSALQCSTGGHSCPLPLGACGGMGLDEDEDRGQTSPVNKVIERRRQRGRLEKDEADTIKTHSSPDKEVDNPASMKKTIKVKPGCPTSSISDSMQTCNNNGDNHYDMLDHSINSKGDNYSSLQVLRSMSGSINREARIDLGTSRCSTDGREDCSEVDEMTQTSLVIVNDGTMESAHRQDE